MSTYTREDGGSVSSLSRQANYFADKQTREVVDEFTDRWELAEQQVETLLKNAEEKIKDGAYPLVPQTIIGVVANIFGFSPRGGWVDSEIHSKAEALPGKSMLGELTTTR